MTICMRTNYLHLKEENKTILVYHYSIQNYMVLAAIVSFNIIFFALQ